MSDLVGKWLAGNPAARAALTQSGDLQLILKDLDTNAVAIKASGIFPITYSLLANVSFDISLWANMNFIESKS